MQTDTGWAWVVLVASMGSNYLSGFLLYFVGIIHTGLLTKFDHSVTVTAWVGALYSSLMCLSAPLASWVITRYGCRICCVVGGILCFFGFVTSSFVTSVSHLFITYGLMAGTGLGLAYSPTCVTIGFYFHKFRNLVCGVSASAAAVGILSGSLIAQRLLDDYSVAGTFLIIGAMSLHFCFFGLFFRPTMFELRGRSSIKVQSCREKEKTLLLTTADKGVLRNSLDNLARCPSLGRNLESGSLPGRETISFLEATMEHNKLSGNVKHDVTVTTPYVTQTEPLLREDSMCPALETRPLIMDKTSNDELCHRLVSAPNLPSIVGEPECCMHCEDLEMVPLSQSRDNECIRCKWPFKATQPNQTGTGKVDEYVQTSQGTTLFASHNNVCIANNKGCVSQDSACIGLDAKCIAQNAMHTFHNNMSSCCNNPCSCHNTVDCVTKNNRFFPADQIQTFPIFPAKQHSKSLLEVCIHLDTACKDNSFTSLQGIKPSADTAELGIETRALPPIYYVTQSDEENTLNRHSSMTIKQRDVSDCIRDSCSHTKDATSGASTSTSRVTSCVRDSCSHSKDAASGASTSTSRVTSCVRDSCSHSKDAASGASTSTSRVTSCVRVSCGGFRRNLKHVLNKAFSFHCASVFMANMAMSGVYLHLPVYTQTYGTTPNQAATLFIAVGVLSLVSRLASGFATSEPRIDPLTFNMGMTGLCGLATGLFPLYADTYAGQMTFSALFGLYTGGQCALITVVTVHLVGIRYLATAQAVLLVCTGIGYIAGPPLSALIVDRGGTYGQSFVYLGSTMFLGSVLDLCSSAFVKREGTEDKEMSGKIIKDF